MRAPSLLLPRSSVLVTLVVAILLPRWVHADEFALKATQTGHLDYVFVGNSMSDNQGLSNGTNCLMPSNTVTVDANMLTARPRLISATLYVSGSLIDDGVDEPSTGLQLFDDPTACCSPTLTQNASVVCDPNVQLPSGCQPLRYTDEASQATLNAEARASAAVSVQFQGPGASAPVTVSTTADAAYLSAYAITAGSESGNVGFFTTPIDVTETLRAAGGTVAGTYTVSGLVADVCMGTEAVCDANLTRKCATVHTNGNASFALLLVYEDLALPLRSVSVFEGLTELSNKGISEQLINGNAVSDPASGSLTFYVLEGDLSIGVADSTKTCGGDEYVQVTAGNKSLCLTDPDNPVGNIFNGSINTLPPPHPNPSGCTGPHACGLAGVDVDRFDISAALSPGVTEIDIAVHTGSDLIALSGVVLGVDVYQPLLQYDSQFRLLNSLSSTAVQVGGDVTVSLAISNTGNLAADDVQVAIPLPAGLEDVEILESPAKAQVQRAADSLLVTGFTVAPGKVSEVRFRFTTACSMLNQTLNLYANVSAAQVAPFRVQAPPLAVGGPGLESCVGLDPGGPFATLNPARVLRGDGCASASPGGWAPCITALLGLAALRRRPCPRRGDPR